MQLIAIDGNSLMHRAYWALPNMTTKDGFPTGALHGFLNMLLKLTEREPNYLVVAFDMHMPTFRHESYAEYKAGRKETPDDLRAQFPVLKELLAEMGVAVCECPRFEADDIIGTFAKRCEAENIDALLVTGDRDSLQLIGDRTHVLMTKKGITETIEYDAKTLFSEYGLSPERMRDLKGLMGDASDHIPGVPGVGEKTALKLLAEYGDLENVLLHASEIKGKLGEKITENAESARMSYRLGTIDTNAPIAFSLDDCRFLPDHMRNARAHLLELELRSVANRVSTGDLPAAEPTHTKSAPVQRITLSDVAALDAVLTEHATSRMLALDASERLSFAFDAEIAYEITSGGDLFSAVLDEHEVWQTFQPFFANETNTVLAFDTKRLRHLLSSFAITPKCAMFDAMIADYLLNATRPAQSFAALCERYDANKEPSAAMLFDLQAEMLRALKQNGMEKLCSEMEMPLSIVLYEMEQEGFLIDKTVLYALQKQFQREIESLEASIYEFTGERFNILSPKQLGDVLFVKLGLPTQRKTKSGYSTDADTLQALAERHPAIPLILQYRFLTKLKSTFVDGLLNACGADGRVRTRFNQCVTATGRISSTEPNLQNIPVRTVQGREIRKAFVPSVGNVLVGGDYSQIELRLLAHISGDERMIAAFNSGKDFHAVTASEVFGVPLDEVTVDLRSAAKAVNFGIVYGISDFGLATNLGIPVRQASEYIKLYFTRYPRVKTYLDESVESAKRLGYAVTLFDRRRSMPELTSQNHNTRSFGERVAMNMPIQGTAADVIKLAMVKATNALSARGLGAKLILQVHDELIFDTPKDEAETVAALVKDCMEQVASFSVPLEADVKIGESWYQTK